MIKATAKDPTPEEKMDRVLNVEITVDQEEEEECKAINRIVRACVEVEMHQHQHKPQPQKAIEAALNDLYTLGVIGGSGVEQGAL